MKFCFSILLFLSSMSLFAQLNTVEFAQLDSLQKIEKRTVIIFIHTDWCRYCQAMKNTTLKNDKIIEQMNKHFYFIELNAEEKKNIVFNNYIFKYRPTGNNTGTHELSEQLGTVDGKVAYPTLCFLNPANEITFQYPQYINSADLLTVLMRLK